MALRENRLRAAFYRVLASQLARDRHETMLGRYRLTRDLHGRLDAVVTERRPRRLRAVNESRLPDAAWLRRTRSRSSGRLDAVVTARTVASPERSRKRINKKTTRLNKEDKTILTRTRSRFTVPTIIHGAQNDVLIATFYKSNEGEIHGRSGKANR